MRSIISQEGAAYKLEALRSLERYTPGEREEILELALRSKSWYVRLYAVLFSYKYGGKGLVPELIPLTMVKEEDAVRSAAAESLKRITGKDFGPDFNAWFRWAKSQGMKLTYPGPENE